MTRQEHDRLLQLRHEADIEGLLMMYGADGKKQGIADDPPERGESIDREDMNDD